MNRDKIINRVWIATRLFFISGIFLGTWYFVLHPEIRGLALFMMVWGVIALILMDNSSQKERKAKQ